jgi:hypothetical protein
MVGAHNKFSLSIHALVEHLKDWYSIQYPEAMTRVMEKKMATISQALMIPRPDNPAALIEAELWCEYFQDYIPPGTDCMQPMR